MPRLRNLPLDTACVRTSTPLGEAVSSLLASDAAVVAVVDGVDRVRGVLGEHDVLRAVFPGYLGELRHSSFLPDDPSTLDELWRGVSARPVSDFARRTEVLSADESETHAAERFLHTGAAALPVVDGDRYLGMLRVTTLLRERARGDSSA